MATMYKFIITGAFNAGKTTFVNTLSDISTVNTDKAISVPIERDIKATTTTALDYGQVNIKGQAEVHLFGTPGQPRFDFMRDILAEGMDGFVFLVDVSDWPRLDEAGQLLAKFQEIGQYPCIVVANKADLDGISTEDLRIQLNLPANQLIVSCIATDKDAVRAVVEQLVALVESI